MHARELIKLIVLSLEFSRSRPNPARLASADKRQMDFRCKSQQVVNGGQQPAGMLFAARLAAADNNSRIS